MSSQPESEIIHIIFTEEDILDMVAEHNEDSPDHQITEEDALRRAREWRKGIEDSASERIYYALQDSITTPDLP